MTVRTYDRLYKVLLLTCVINCTTGTPTPQLCPVVQWSVHWAPSWTIWVLVLARARHYALGTCRKKMRAPLLGLAKSIYQALLTIQFPWLSGRASDCAIQRSEVQFLVGTHSFYFVSHLPSAKPTISLILFTRNEL